jgi:hypothetical protein
MCQMQNVNCQYVFALVPCFAVTCEPRHLFGKSIAKELSATALDYGRQICSMSSRIPFFSPNSGNVDFQDVAAVRPDERP